MTVKKLTVHTVTVYSKDGEFIRRYSKVQHNKGNC